MLHPGDPLNKFHKVHFKNYSRFRSDRSFPHRRGDTLIICKDCLDPIYRVYLITIRDLNIPWY